MALSELFRTLRRRWLVVALLTLTGLGLAWAYTSSRSMTYTSTTRLYVSMATGTSVNDSLQGALAAQQRIASYAQVATGSTVAQRVVDELRLPLSARELQGRLDATFPPATMLLDISATDSTPEQARRVAEATAVQFSRLVGEMESTTANAAPLAEATVVDPARTPTEPNGPGRTRLLAVGLLVGFGAGCLAALFRDRLDRTIRTSQQLARALPVPVLATISEGSRDRGRHVSILRARLLAAHGGGDRMALLFTSFSERSAPCAAVLVAKALAHSGRRVVLVDADISGGGLSQRLDTGFSLGVAEWLREEYTPIDDLPWVDAGFTLLPLGAVDAATPHLLASESFLGLLARLETSFDCIVVDASPVLADGTALVLSTHCDATVAVVELGTSSTTVRDAWQWYSDAGQGLVGVVGVTPFTRRFLPMRLRRPGAVEAEVGLVHIP
jgi:receptor protein-tyrosine kinase